MNLAFVVQKRNINTVVVLYKIKTPIKNIINKIAAENTKIDLFIDNLYINLFKSVSFIDSF